MVALPVLFLIGRAPADVAVSLIALLLLARSALDRDGAKGETCQELPMRYWVPDDAMPLVQVRVGGIDYPVTLDTGSSGTLKLFDPDRVGPTKPVAGVRGEASVVVDKVPSLTFGPLSLTDLEISYGAPNLGETPGARQGNLGNGVLQHVVLTLDYPSRRMTVCAGGAS